MHVGAIVTVRSSLGPQRPSEKSNPTHTANIPPIARWDLLGKSVLDRAIERLQAFGIGEITVIAEEARHPAADSTRSASGFWSSWDAAISRCLQFELGTLLMIRVGPYVELNVADFLRFHRETSSAMTQVYDHRGALDLVAIDAKRLSKGTASFRNRLRDLIPSHQRYRFDGYSNRLASVADFRRLAKDALTGIAGIRPIGNEISPNVWVSKDARIHQSARICGPAYIGKNSRVNAWCTIRGASAVEQQCEIDCGTTVDDSCVLAGSYIGAGLHVCGSILCHQTLFHLGRDLQLQFHDSKLFAKTSGTRILLPSTRGTQVPYSRSVAQ